MSETETVRLEVGRPLLKDLSGGGLHSYLVRLEPGQYVRLAADQRGIDVVLRLLGPDGALLREVDSPNGSKGAERVSAVASLAGDFRVEVEPAGATARPGRYEVSLEAVRMATEEDRRRVEAEKVYQEGEGLRRQLDWVGARSRYETALGLWRSLSDRSAEALALCRIGQTFEKTGEAERAVEYFRQGLAAYRAAGEAEGEAMALNRLGWSLQALGSLEEAAESFQLALAIFQRSSDLFGQATTHNFLGAAHQAAGRTGPAIEAFQRAAALWRQLEEPKNEGRSQSNLGGLYLVQGRPEEARDALEASLGAAVQAGDAEQRAVALSSLGELDVRQGRLAEARAHLDEALALQRQIGDEQGQAMTLGSLGTARLKAGDLEGAWSANQEALALFRRRKDAASEGVVLSNLARIQFARGEDREAVAQQRQARGLFERLGDREGIAQTRFGAARSLARLGELEEARRELEGSLDKVEALRTEEPGLGLRAAFFATKQHYWELYADILMRLHERDPGRGFDALALESSERRRARSLLDALRETRAQVESEADPELALQIGEVEARLHVAERRRMAIAGADGDEAALAAVEAELRSRLGRLDVLRSQMSRRSAKSAGLSRPQPVTAQEIQKSLVDPGTLVLVYSLGEERSFLWTVSSRSIESFVLAGRSSIEAAARQLIEALPRTSREAEAAGQRSARGLADLVLAPAAERIAGFGRLVVVGDGALQLVPFAVLPAAAEAEGAPSRLLVQDHELVNLPSVSVLAELRQRGRKRKPLDQLKIAVVADPVFRADDPRVEGAHPRQAARPPAEGLRRSARYLDLDALERLPYTRQEGEAILAIGKGLQPFRAFDFAASLELFTKGGLDGYDVLHIATHSLLDSRQPELSGIAFSLVDSTGAPRDGFLRLHEIYGLNLKASLVVLSSCETGGGRELRGEGLMGLTRGFLAAGVPQLVVSLWKVEDSSTAELMRRFYQQLLVEGQPTAAALRQAQDSMREDPEWSAPHHWAGFVFVGDDRKARSKGGLEEQDAGGVVLVKKAKSDLQPPTVPPDRPAKRQSGGAP